MIEELHAIASRIKQHNISLQIREAGRPWTTTETMLGFTNDVGTLSRLVMEHAQLRPSRGDLESRIEHELADCLWSVLTLADELNVDLGQALVRLEDEILGRKE